MNSLVTRIQTILKGRPDLLKPSYRTQPDRDSLTGHCYVASEAYYHARGGRDAGLTPYCLRHQGDTHWFLRDAEGTIIDLTESQFETPIPYNDAVAKGFLTKHPSKRAREVLNELATAAPGRE